MAKVTRVTTVCDVCGQEVETNPVRLAGGTGNVRNADLCDSCQDKPFREVMAKVGATRVRGGAGRRPAAVTAEALEKLKADRKAEEEAAKPAPRKRAARKATQVKG